MNNKLQLYAFVVTSLCCFLLGLVAAQNFGNPSEARQLQASVSSMVDSGSTSSRVTTPAAGGSANMQDALAQIQTDAGNIKSGAIRDAIGSVPGQAQSAIQTAVPVAGVGIAKAKAGVDLVTGSIGGVLGVAQDSKGIVSSILPKATEAVGSLGGLTSGLGTALGGVDLKGLGLDKLNIPGVDLSKLTAAQQKILGERVATANATMCPAPTSQLPNLAGLQQAVSNAGNGGSSVLSGLTGGLNFGSAASTVTTLATNTVKGAIGNAASGALKSIGL